MFHLYCRFPSSLRVRITRLSTLLLLILQPLAWHCLLLIARPQSPSARTFLQAYCSYFKTMFDTTMEDSMSWQLQTSSLSTGKAKAVATVCKMAIALCSHRKWAPKCLSPLIFTNLEIWWALKLGDGQKIEPTMVNTFMFVTVTLIYNKVIRIVYEWYRVATIVKH